MPHNAAYCCTLCSIGISSGFSILCFDGVRYTTKSDGSYPAAVCGQNKRVPYSTKKTKAGGKLVDATAATEADLQNELDKVAKAYGGGAGVDMTSFPTLKFSDPAIDSINITQQ